MPLHRPLALLFAAFVSTAAPAAATAKCGTEFTFDPRPALTLADVKRLSEVGPIDGVDIKAADGASLVVWAFDEEDHPVVGPRRAIALLYVTRGDLGEKAVGGELLQLRSKPAISLSRLAIEKWADGLQLVLPTAGGCPSYSIRLDGHGRLTVQGRLVGTLR